MKHIFVGNLNLQTTEQDLYAAFSEYGAVERVNIVTDRETGQPRGFAFVEMLSEDVAEQAISSLNGVEFDGRLLTVNAGGGSTAVDDTVVDAEFDDRDSVPTASAERTKGQDVGSHESRSPRGLSSKSRVPEAATETSGFQQQTDRAQALVTAKEAYTVDLEGIVTVTARAIEVFGTREKALRWLRTPLPSLSDRTPLSILNTTDGIEHIQDVLGRIEQGVW